MSSEIVYCAKIPIPKIFLSFEDINVIIKFKKRISNNFEKVNKWLNKYFFFIK